MAEFEDFTPLELKVARWICVLNSWEWPTELSSGGYESNQQRIRLAFWVLSSVVPYAKWIRVWNGDDVWKRRLKAARAVDAVDPVNGLVEG